jgi:hypothetical protein
MSDFLLKIRCAPWSLRNRFPVGAPGDDQKPDHWPDIFSKSLRLAFCRLGCDHHAAWVVVHALTVLSKMLFEHLQQIYRGLLLASPFACHRSDNHRIDYRRKEGFVMHPHWHRHRLCWMFLVSTR